ncbi:hypothetical protein H1R20_g2543, partial [Candolleomyces eurysporus]
MYGQTNCFVGTGIKRGVFDNQEAYVCTLRAARNMVFQGVITPWGNIEQLAKLVASIIVGTKIKVQLVVNPEAYVLPLDNVLATKSPSIAIYGDMTAPAIVKPFKIQSQKETKQLAEAKEIAYKGGFVRDSMIEADWCLRMRNPKILSSRMSADTLKYECEYFYPFDIRSSAKDLVPNQLTFALYNHAALFPDDKRPLSMRTNGHLMLNGKKMSKSTGNSLTLREAIEKFGADATRLSLADAGGGLEYANFKQKTANANILHAHTFLCWCEDMAKDQANLRTGPRNYHDIGFENEVNDLINITHSHYEATNYNDALKYGFYELQSARDWYREVTSDVGMRRDLVLYWIRTAALLITPSPLTLPNKSGPTSSPNPNPFNMHSGLHHPRPGQGQEGEHRYSAPFDPKKPKSVRIYAAKEFPEWQNTAVQTVKDAYDEKEDKVDDAKIRQLLVENGLIKDKRVEYRNVTV